MECEDFQSPGFYRCRDSLICLHPDHLCDGIPHCPLHEDEYTCNITCPSECTCRGLEYTCTHTFLTNQHPRLRYLDGSGSNIKIPDLVCNHELIFLRLAYCNLTTISSDATNIQTKDRLYFPNLVHLDISYNNLKTLDINFFQKLSALRNLFIGSNPFSSSFHFVSFTNSLPTSLKIFDISNLSLTDAVIHEFINQPRNENLLFLNISKMSLKILPSLSNLRSLEVLDLSDNPVDIFSRDVFFGLTNLRELFTYNPMLCCPQLQPDHNKNCRSKASMVSTCQNLLRSNTYRVFSWTLSIAAVASNSASFLHRFVS